MRELTVDLFSTVDGWASGGNSPAYFGTRVPTCRRGSTSSWPDRT
jgi:hypothetical protein